MTDIINTGTAANAGNGDPLRAAFIAINQKFTELSLYPRGAWAASTAYTVTPRREWVTSSGTAYVATVNHTSGNSFATDLAAGKWLALDVAQLITDFAAPGGSSLVGYDGGTVQAVLDGAVSMQRYTQLRAYPGRATSLRITTPGIAGQFIRLSSATGLTDNGGTLIIDGLGRAWQRVYDGPMYLSWFQVPVAPANGTAEMQNAIDSASALYLETGAQTDLVFPPARTYLIDTITVKSGIYINGRNCKITPTSAITGRFVGADIDTLRIRGLKFQQTAGVNYLPAIYLQGGSGFDLEYCDFTGCGYGCRTLLVNNVTYLRNTLSQVGIYPRPAGSIVGWESETGADNVKKSKAAYLKYGAGLRSEEGYNINFEHNYFDNESFASGCFEDWDGGAGAFTTYRANDVTFLEGSAINAPGQGFMCAGDWEGTTVPSDILAGTFDYNLRGKNIRFIAPYASGCNQEGVTSYGCGKVTFSGVVSENNAMAALEAWSSWGVTVDGGVLENKVKHAGMSPGPVGAFNIVDSFGVTSSNVLIKETRNSGIRIGGSYNVQVNGGSILDYGTDDVADGLYSSGVVLLAGSAETFVSNEVSVTGITFGRKVRTNNTGSDIFVNATDPTLAHDFAGNRAIGRNVTINSGGLTSWQSETYYSKDQTGYLWGNTARRPNGAIRSQRTLSVGSTAKAILSLSNIAPAITGSDAFLVLVNGTRDDASNQTFADVVLVLGSGTPTVISAVGNTTPPDRTYTVSGSNLMLSMAANLFSVRVSAFTAGNGHIGNA